MVIMTNREILKNCIHYLLIQRIYFRGEEFNRSIRFNNVFTKVPGRFLARFFLQPLVEGMLVFSLHGYFFKHLKGDTVVLLTKFSDLLAGTRFLSAKIISRESQHDDLIA